MWEYTATKSQDFIKMADGSRRERRTNHKWFLNVDYADVVYFEIEQISYPQSNGITPISRTTKMDAPATPYNWVCGLAFSYSFSHSFGSGTAESLEVAKENCIAAYREFYLNLPRPETLKGIA